MRGCEYERPYGREDERTDIKTVDEKRIETKGNESKCVGLVLRFRATSQTLHTRARAHAHAHAHIPANRNARRPFPLAQRAGRASSRSR